MCYLSISSILWKQRGNKASNQSPELPRQTRMVENFNTMRHDELGTESGRSFGTPRCVNLQDLMFQSCPFSTGPWQNSHCPCLQFGFPPYGCSWPVESFEWLGCYPSLPFSDAFWHCFLTFFFALYNNTYNPYDIRIVWIEYCPSLIPNDLQS